MRTEKYIVARVHSLRGASLLCFVDYIDLVADVYAPACARFALKRVDYCRSIVNAMPMAEDVATMVSRLASKQHGGEFAVVPLAVARKRWSFTRGRDA
jgi:hypothetical protein